MTRTSSPVNLEVVRTGYAAAYLGLTPASVRRHARNGRIPFVRIGIEYRFRLVDLESYRMIEPGSRMVFASSTGPLTHRQVERIFGNRNWRYYCPDRNPESILPALKREIQKQCRKEARREWSHRIRQLKQQVFYLRRRSRHLLRTPELAG